MPHGSFDWLPPIFYPEDPDEDPKKKFLRGLAEVLIFLGIMIILSVIVAYFTRGTPMDVPPLYPFGR